MTATVDLLGLSGEGLELRLPDGGDPVAVRVHQLAVASAGDIPDALTITVELDRDGWDRVDAAEALGLSAEARGPGTVPGGGPVRIEARLDDDVLADVYSGELLTAHDAWLALRDDAPGWEDAHRTDAWFAMTVTAELLEDHLAAGLRTRWADAGHLASGAFEGGDEPIDL